MGAARPRLRACSPISGLQIASRVKEGHLQQGNAGNEASARNTPDSAARAAGLLLILTALTTLVAVFGRVTADADRETLQETLAAIADSRSPYALSGAGRLASGVTLAVAAWYLSRTWIVRERPATPIVPALFGISGLVTVVSGLLAIALAIALPGGGEAATSTHESMAGVRWLTGVAGFSAAGLALVLASVYQYRVGGRLRLIAPISAVLGGSMQLIWISGLIVLHQLTGALFFVWLIVIGAMLLTRRVENHYRANSSVK